jgi:hypothetical protein
VRWLREMMERAELLPREVVAQPQSTVGVEPLFAPMQELHELLVQAGLVPGGGPGAGR